MKLLILYLVVGMITVTLLLTAPAVCGMLFPKESESREIKNLNGMWYFRADTNNRGFHDKWFDQPLQKTGSVIAMPVPSSFNDITQDKSLRDHIGWVWYQRDFFVSRDWSKKRVVIRIDSAHYYSVVWVNGKLVMSHIGGHLPFESEINDVLHFGVSNVVTVAVNNTLSPTTLPPGILHHYPNSSRFPEGFIQQWYQFDFFNYAGIHRSVKLYTTPKVWIDDITVVTDIYNNDGVLHYTILTSANVEKIIVTVEDCNGEIVGLNTSLKGEIVVRNVNLWWPYDMNKSLPAYRYTLLVNISSNRSSEAYLGDVYRLKFGFRTIKVTQDKFLINGKEFYCRGVGMHEDSDIRGKGLDYALIAKNFNLLKWLGANCFRTSHYPYAEEIMEEADSQGFAVIDESPGVGIVKKEFYSKQSLHHHMAVMTELVTRDKNRPSVIMWSVANEPSSQKKYAEPYFRAVIEHTRRLDPTRPVTVVMGQGRYYNDRVSQYCDVVCINNYFAWYGQFGGRTEVVKYQLTTRLDGWFARLHKPIIVTEYGAGTINGMHASPSTMWTEEYQCDFMTEYHRVFDEYKRRFLIGEMVWNFADFMTQQKSTRVNGNRKGLFTRQRQPKMAAHMIRARYYELMGMPPLTSQVLYFIK